jgi:hypothetical protein
MRRFGPLLIAPLALAACIEAVPPGEDVGTDPLTPGDTLTADGVAWQGSSLGSPSLVFSADGQEIIVVTAPPTSAAGISAIHTGTRATRELVTMTCCPHALQLSADGAWLFFAASTASPANIDRMSPAGTNRSTIVRSVLPYALSADGRFLAVAVLGATSASDSLLRLDLSTGTRVAARAPGVPVVLSPDGVEAVTSRIESSIIRHERFGFDGVARGLINEFTLGGVPATPGASVVQIRWTDSLRLLLFRRELTSPSGTFLRRAIPGAAELIVTVPIDPITLVSSLSAAPQHAWTTDGARIALWVQTACLEGTVSNCTLSRYALHLITPGAQTTRIVAQVSTRQPAATTFSRDGRKIAYIAAGRVFLVSVP